MGEQFKWNPAGERMGQMLRQAVYMEDWVTLEHLVKKKADLEARDEAGSTPLHIAATRCKPETITWLITQRADPAALDGEGFSALSWACMKGHREVMDLLLAAGANLHELTGPTDDARQAKEPDKGKSALALTAERGHLECVIQLLRSRAEIEQPNHNESTALMCAAHQGEAEIVACLLEKQSIVNVIDAEGWNALMYAVNASVPGSAAGSEDAEKKVSIDGVMGRRCTTELMLLNGVDVNAQNADGLTAMMIAAGRDRPQAVKALVEAKGEVNLTTAHGETALLMAASHDLPGVARALIMAAADVNHANEKKETALAIAEKFAYKEVYDLLKKAGAVDAKGKKGKKGKKK